MEYNTGGIVYPKSTDIANRVAKLSSDYIILGANAKRLQTAIDKFSGSFLGTIYGCPKCRTDKHWGYHWYNKMWTNLRKLT